MSGHSPTLLAAPLIELQKGGQGLGSLPLSDREAEALTASGLWRLTYALASSPTRPCDAKGYVPEE
jgi:hypothetical protein